MDYLDSEDFKRRKRIYAKLRRAEKHRRDSGRACSGLDMSNVPAGAVRELVEATMWRDEAENTRLSIYNIPGHKELSQICEAAREAYKKAIAPFIKE